MKKMIQENRQELSRLFGAIETTDKQQITFDEGIEKSVELVRKMVSAAGKLIWIGNGGSAAIAGHMATDFLKNVGVPAIAFNEASLITCISNDLGYEHVFAKPIELLAKSEDVLVAISSSGASKNILNAVTAAKKKNLQVLTLSGFDSANPLRKEGVINFYVPSRHYGHVEDIHQSICHCLIDMMLQTKKGGK